MRACFFFVLALTPAAATADVIEPFVECPPGEMNVGRPGCGGHGSTTVCGPARCADDTTCGDARRCVDVARCIETVELHCTTGDGRRPESERPVSVFNQDQDRGPCTAEAACAGAARCEHFRECQPVPAALPVVAPAPSGVAAEAPTGASATAPPLDSPGCDCTAGRASLPSAAASLFVCGAVASGGRRRRRRQTHARQEAPARQSSA